MIQPISTDCTTQPNSLNSTTPEPVNKHLSCHTDSTLASLNCKGGVGTILGGVKEFFIFIFSFLKWVFCCGCCCAPKPPSNKISFPEGVPKGLSSNSAFAQLMFTPEGKFKNEQGYQRICEMFSRFATTGPLDWRDWYNNGDLKARKNEIRDMHLHPLEFLYFITWDKTTTARMVSYRTTSNNPAWQLVFIPTGKHPWGDFLKGQVKQFEKRHASEISAVLPGFCKALDLEPGKVQDFVNEKQWRGLVEFVIEERRKHFNLS